MARTPQPQLHSQAQPQSQLQSQLQPQRQLQPRLPRRSTPASGASCCVGVWQMVPRVGAAGLDSWIPRLLVVLVIALCTSPTMAHKSSNYGVGTESNVHLEAQVTSERGFDQCKGRALIGHCDFYSCLDEALQCVGSKHNRSVAYRFCDMARHHVNDFTTQGRRWARQTNRCALKAISAARHTKRDAWCSQVDGATKQALVDCARTSGICHVLWTERDVLRRIFSTRSWLTVVEAAKQCPRTLVNRFIFWTLGQMYIYR